MILNKKVAHGNFIYSINEENKTACVILCIPNNEIIIPHSINYENQEYIITEISESAFQYTKDIDSIKFAKNSEVQIIDNFAFFIFGLDADNKKLTIPSSVKEIKEKWCENIDRLKKIKIAPNNQYYKSYENKYIL